jgi:hypothetical protein
MMSSGFYHFLAFHLNPRIPESLTPQAHTSSFGDDSHINHPEAAAAVNNATKNGIRQSKMTPFYARIHTNLLQN